MKTDILTGLSYPEPEDDYVIFEDFVTSLMRFNYMNSLKMAMIPNGLDDVNIAHDTGDFFNFTNDILIKHPISAKMITISKSVEFPQNKRFRLRDGSVFGITIPALMNENMEISLQEKTKLAKDDYSFLVLGVRYGSKVHLANGKVIDV